MKKSNLLIFTLVIAGLFFMATGCAKVIKEEEIKKSAAPSAQAQEEKAVVGKAEEVKQEKVAEQPIKQEAAAAVKEEKIAEQPVTEAPVSEAAAQAGKEASAAAAAGDEMTELTKKDEALFAVYFDFDRFTIMDDMKPVLDKNAQWLKKKDGVKIQIQGHADERGTNEYNIALGERRAQGIKKYLVDSGVNEARLFTISYGEEKPADPGHTEEAWAKNRRGEFVIIK
ncbi:MAG: peptidoglycan-associated lipoprotein Pal [Deltaproteobacteria bacterium]|nr:peptidoglycan-associated lipoprotein Pal [Deltaproteobacteria bacterium]